MDNACSVCGANLDMVGRAHRCIPITRSSASALPSGTGNGGSVPSVAQRSDSHSGSSAPAASTFDRKAYQREYMRGYMRKYREKT